jgi:hypothetical protein
MINVYKLIGKRDLTYLSDAEILKNKIKEVLQKGEKVIVSFDGTEMIYPIFLQKSIGELYLEVEDITYLDKIEFKYLNDDQDLLEYIIDNFKNERAKMDNQHRKIKGYRELNQEEIDAMNEVKAMGVKLGELVEKLENNKDLDQRWIESGKTDLQKGLMALTRSIARPEFF